MKKAILVSFMLRSSIVVAAFVAFLLFRVDKAKAGIFCGGTQNIDPINFRTPNPMTHIYANPSSLETLCNTSETKAVNNASSPSITWNPQLINWGMPPFGDIQLTYRIVWYKINSRGGDANSHCVANWDVINESQDGKALYPQTEMGNSPTYTEVIQHRAGACDTDVWPYSWPCPLPHNPPHQIDKTFTMEMNNGSTLATGWYQGDLQPSCDGGSTWEDVSLGAFFVKMDPNTVATPPYCTTPTGSIVVDVKFLPFGCSDTSTIGSISGNSVTYVNSASGSGATTLLPPGIGTLNALPIKDVNDLNCSDISYDIKLSRLDYPGYTFCETLNNNNGWNRQGNYWRQAVPSIPEAAPTVNLSSIYVESDNIVSKWVSNLQGNALAIGGNMTLEGVPGGVPADAIIKQYGSVITTGSINLTNGSVGPESPATNTVYTYQNYSANPSTAIDAIVNMDITSKPNDIRVIVEQGSSGKCRPITGVTSHSILFFDDCDVEVDNDSFFPSGIDLAIFDGGDLEVDKEVSALNISFIVNGDASIKGDKDEDRILDINGYLWVGGTLSVERRMDVNSNFEFIDNTVLDSLIPTGNIHWIQFD